VTPRGLLSILWNAEKALDVLETALDLGLLARLDAGPVTLGELVAQTGAVPARLYKFLDCLESLELVAREEPTGKLEDARYRAIEPLEEATRLVLGPASLERDRDRYDWRAIRGRLPEVLRGEHHIASFDWPPRTPEQVAGFEASMAHGIGPILEAFGAAGPALFGLPKATGEKARGPRWIDIGGGDGVLALEVLARTPGLEADVYNLPAVEPLVHPRREDPRAGGRLGFVGGDFLAEDLPRGYDVLSFVRVLHDWPADVSRRLLKKAHAALADGAKIVICEEFRTSERLAVQFFWTYFLMGVDSCVSRLREVDFYTRELSALGFRDVTVLPGPFDLVIATR
jgi:demethylspheroidene O-methyltransferase